MTSTSSFFFFDWYGDPRALHSFPTRRSSDLDPDRRVRERAARPGTLHPRGGARGGRSEEHTSELQSRFDLVCRLLLEKKKRARRVPRSNGWSAPAGFGRWRAASTHTPASRRP